MTLSKYNPNKNGRANRPHKNPKYIMADGTYLPYGTGCHVCPNCFECTDEYAFNCQYNEKTQGGGK